MGSTGKCRPPPPFLTACGSRTAPGQPRTACDVPDHQPSALAKCSSPRAVPRRARICTPHMRKAALTLTFLVEPDTDSLLFPHSIFPTPNPPAFQRPARLLSRGGSASTQHRVVPTGLPCPRCGRDVRGPRAERYLVSGLLSVVPTGLPCPRCNKTSVVPAERYSSAIAIAPGAPRRQLYQSAGKGNAPALYFAPSNPGAIICVHDSDLGFLPTPNTRRRPSPRPSPPSGQQYAEPPPTRRCTRP
jgi:hypothetical protein